MMIGLVHSTGLEKRQTIASSLNQTIKVDHNCKHCDIFYVLNSTFKNNSQDNS